MMVITASRNKYGIGTIPLHDLKTQQVPVEFQRPVDVRHFEVNMTNAG